MRVVSAISGDVDILPRGMLGRRFPQVQLGSSVRYLLAESLDMSDAAVARWVWLLSDALDVSESVSGAQIIVSLVCDESLNAQDRLVFGRGLLADESFSMSDNLTALLLKFLTVAEAIALSDSAESLQTHMLALAELFLLADAVSVSKALGLADAVSVADGALDQVQLMLSAVDELAASDALTNVLTLMLSAEEEAGIGDAIDERLILQLALADGIVFVHRLRIEGEDYSAWVVNPDTGGAWQYDNYGFPGGMAQVRGKYVGLKDDGLYELVGADDDGAEIAAYLRTGLTDFGTSRLKNIPRAYIGYASETGLVLKTITTDGGKKKERWYRLRARPLEAPVESRVKLGRGVRARYWGFEVHNFDGGEVSFDKLQVLPVVLRRRV